MNKDANKAFRYAPFIIFGDYSFLTGVTCSINSTNKVGDILAEYSFDDASEKVTFSNLKTFANMVIIIYYPNISKAEIKENSESFNNGYNLNLTDWNSISAPGIYSGNGSDAKNSPSYSEGIWINAIAFASNGNKNYITIIAFYGLHISVKTKAKETWSGWELLV